jgi:hypothetical protein
MDEIEDSATETDAPAKRYHEEMTATLAHPTLLPLDAQRPGRIETATLALG